MKREKGEADRWRKRGARGKREMGREGVRGECSRGEAEVAGGAEGRVNSAPTRRRGRSEPGTEGSAAPPPPHRTRRGQLSYAGLTASVCCVLAVCLDSPALLSQQLNNRWLKKASIQSGPDQKITPRKVHRLQTKHTDASRAHTCK